MIILWVICVVLPRLQGHTISVTESVEDIPDNITSLYPVSLPHRNDHFDVQPLHNNDDLNANKDTKLKSEATVWKIETAYAESKLPKPGGEKEPGKDVKDDKDDRVKEDSKEEATIERPENKSKEFKPSVHLGDFFDLDDVAPPKTEMDQFDSFSPLFQKHHSGFKGYPKDSKRRPQDYSKFGDFPYKFHSSTRTKTKENWKSNSLDAKLLAGGLYKYQDPFIEKPNGGSDDADNGEDFALELNGDFKETATKKRPHPWKHLLHSLAAIIPVGLIIAALTPNIITVEDTGQATPYSNRYARSVNTPLPRSSPPISERCRRRLLCELYTDKHYVQTPREQSDLSSNCARYHCNDPRTLTKLLVWMFRSHSKSKGTLTNIL